MPRVDVPRSWLAEFTTTGADQKEKERKRQRTEGGKEGKRRRG
jgi:hypothetical protein